MSRVDREPIGRCGGCKHYEPAFPSVDNGSCRALRTGTAQPTFLRGLRRRPDRTTFPTLCAARIESSVKRQGLVPAFENRDHELEEDY